MPETTSLPAGPEPESAVAPLAAPDGSDLVCEPVPETSGPVCDPAAPIEAEGAPAGTISVPAQPRVEIAPGFDPRDLLKSRNGKFRVDPVLVYPPFLERVLRVLRRCHERGQDYYGTSGTRFYEEQAKLHAAYLAGRGSRAAPAGYSAHQWGCAIDFAPDADMDTPGLQGPAYDLKHFAILFEEVRREGLVSGHSFNDDPHVQVPQFVSGASMRLLRDEYLHAAGKPEERLRAVWKWLDKNLKWPALTT